MLRHPCPDHLQVHILTVEVNHTHLALVAINLVAFRFGCPVQDHRAQLVSRGNSERLFYFRCINTGQADDYPLFAFRCDVDGITVVYFGDRACEGVGYWRVGASCW